MTGPLVHVCQPAGPDARGAEMYFAATYRLLGEGGHEAVTVAAICDQLGVSRAAFYHHFRDVPAFLAAFAERWRQGVTHTYATWVAVPDPLRRLELICNDMLDWQNPANAAIFAWSRTEPLLAPVLDELLQLADATTVQIYAELFDDLELGLLVQRIAKCIALGRATRVEGLDQRWLLRAAGEFIRRVVRTEVEVVDLDGCLRLRFLDGIRLDLPSDPTWRPAEQPGLAWADAGAPQRHPHPGRGSRDPEAWFAAGRELLADGGAERITVDSLCRRLNVTKGSFQHHFANMPGFVQALADDWAREQRQRLAALREQTDPLSRLQRLHQNLLRAPDPADLAIRAWAHSEPLIAAAVRQVDRDSRDLLATTIAEALGDPAADLLAEMMHALGLGLHTTRPAVESDTAARLVLLWANRILHLDARLETTGTQPTVVISGQAVR
jgi:AcrR family transcriptional regulator